MLYFLVTTRPFCLLAVFPVAMLIFHIRCGTIAVDCILTSATVVVPYLEVFPSVLVVSWQCSRDLLVPAIPTMLKKQHNS